MSMLKIFGYTSSRLGGGDSRPATINASIQVHLLQCRTAQLKTYFCTFGSIIRNHFIIYEMKNNLIQTINHNF